MVVPSRAEPAGPAAPTPVDLIVLAGGRASRLGGASKPAVEVAGRSLLSRVLDARALARRVVVVGPESARPLVDAGADAGELLWALEDPPFGGPVAGIAAGLDALGRAGDIESGAPEAGWVLLLACDLPWAADAARLLIAAVTDPELPDAVDGVHLVDDAGRAQWLAGAYRTGALRAAVHRIGGAARGASVRSVLGDLVLLGIRDDAGAGTDVDTWQDVSRTTELLNRTIPAGVAPRNGPEPTPENQPGDTSSTPPTHQDPAQHATHPSRSDTQ